MLISRPLASALLRLYDYPHPKRPGRIIRGYDRRHALRTARMCAATAIRLGHPRDRVTKFQIACILHDLGRAGLDRRLFGKIWSWARQRNIPTRPREWRAAYPETRYGKETEAFISRYASALKEDGIAIDGWAGEQIEMRLGFERRMRRRLRDVKSRLLELGIQWTPWMTLVTLYYYYPETLDSAPPWVRELAQTLVACEQFEAYNNRRRGRDYYCRTRETMLEAVSYLKRLQVDRIISQPVVRALLSLAAEGAFERLLIEARGMPLTKRERHTLTTAGMETGS